MKETDPTIADPHQIKDPINLASHRQKEPNMDPSAPFEGEMSPNSAPHDIQIMAEQAVADLEGGTGDLVPMETEPIPPAAAAVATLNNPFETHPTDLSLQTDSPLKQEFQVPEYQVPAPIEPVPPPAEATAMEVDPPVADAPLPATNAPTPADAVDKTPQSATNTDTADKGKKSTKRKTARTVRRVLVAKKEVEAATQIMTGLRDISKVLDPLDAKFLGEQYWVFTQHQLAWLIQLVSPPKEGDNEMKVDASGAEGVGQPEEKKTAESDVLEKPIKTEQQTAETKDWKTHRDMLLASMAAGLKFESSTVVTAALQTADAGISKEISIASREDAEKRLKLWEEKLKTIEGNPFQVEEDSFSLDDAMSFLVPKGFKNFLDSIEIKSLFQFLSLKKTETGALCELYALWRHTCKLSKVTAPAVVRYFLGLHARLEGAIVAVPPCDEKKRKWMNNTIVVMTGASLEFLVEDRGIYTVHEFVDSRTKDLSLSLATWRERKALEPLKGSGKVAMISGWKAVAKEIVVMEESGNGEVVPNLKLMASSDLYLEEDPRPKRPKTSETTKPAPDSTTPAKTPVARKPATSTPSSSSKSGKKTPRGGKAEYDLHSKLFLEQVLGIEATQFLALASIHTAAQLFESESKNDETLLNAMVDADEAKDIAGASGVLKDWTQKLQEHLEAKSSAKKKGRPQGKAIRPETLKDASDPYDLMSDVTRKFLATMDIFTAEKFLSTRTTEIAAEFVKFRKKEGMPELKGLGSIASVSGWKANCRRFARAMGREDLASLEPPEKPASATKRPVPMKAAIIQSTETPAPSSTMTHPGVLFGKSRRMFAVQGESETPMQFRFDVSLRKDDSDSGIGLYLTYKGSGPSIRPANVARLPRAGSTDTIPLLVDTTLTKSGDNEVDARSLFASERTGCGLIDLQKYGVRPLQDQDLAIMKKYIQNFCSGSASQISPELKADQKYNITVRRSDVDKCQYLAVVGSPMQAGQTMGLTFPKVETFLSSPPPTESGDFAERNLLACSLFLLSKDDLTKVADFLAKEIFPAISLESEDAVIVKTGIKMWQRVDWVSRRISAQLSDTKGDKKAILAVSFKSLLQLETLSKLSDEAFNGVVQAVHEELTEAFTALIENDVILGKRIRALWCPLAKELYDEVVAGILSAVMSERSEEHVDYKVLLKAVFKRATELSLDSGVIPKLAFSGSPLDDASESDAKVVVCPAVLPKTEDGEEIQTLTVTQSARYAAIPLEEIEKSSDKSFYSTSPDVSFYRTYLEKIAVKIVTVFGKIVDASDFAAETVLESWKLADVMSPEARASVVAPWKIPVNIPSAPLSAVQPPTEQFFLGIVWPVLREFGWRIEVESFPNERVFAAPKWKGDQQKIGKLAKLAKTHRDRRRQNLAREVNQIGFGAISKLTKRLFVASGGMGKDGDTLGKPAGGRKLLPVRKICDQFIDTMKEASTVNDVAVLDRAKEIVEQVIECFDTLAPSIQSTTIERGLPSEKFGADVFMQFLLVLPALLSRAEVELQEMNDSLELVHELTAYMTHNIQIFPAGMQPTPEIYMTKGKRVPSTLLNRLESKRRGGEGGNASDELTEVLWDDDAKVLSDFVVNVMKQTLACRATEADVTRKFRRIHVGYPGVVCKHCKGEGGEGRYFFTTIESLTTLSTVFEKHIMKCAFVPADIKKDVVTARSKHAEQRKTHPNGAQQAYFNRLWDRLRSMKIAGTTSSSAVPLAKTNGSTVSVVDDVPSEMAAHSDEKMTFVNSMDVLDFVRTSAPWKGTKEIEEALNQYYNCLDYGGRIYMTKSMPEHFSSAWLLNKVVPRRARTSSKRYLPG